MRVDHLANIARRKANRPDAVTKSWECLPFDGPTEAIRLVLSDDDGKWSNPEAVTIDVREEIEEKARFERESGKCFQCGGDGQDWKGWSRGTGHRWGPCRRCNATGAAP